jgi:[acyl-carrier-protein] S-malonyltransferase
LASSEPLALPEPQAHNVAWLFPGQGAQEVGMGRDLWDASPAARRVLETADSVLGFHLSEVCFAGPEEKLRDTRITQPAIMAVSLAALAAAIEAGSLAGRPAFVAGHSLGEYSALVAAGALSLEEGMRLIQARARLMAEAGEAHPGTLAAIMGLEEQAVEAVCREADADVCNLNLPDQTVVGGTREAVEKAMALAKERGARRSVELNVSGAFHSRLMRPAAAGLAEALGEATIGPPLVPVVSNVSAGPLRTAAEVREELPLQIVSPVRWHQSVVNMSAAGVTAFIEFGPGKVLTGLVRRLVPDAHLANVSTYADAGQLKV